jgi:hypothetical protein
VAPLTAESEHDVPPVKLDRADERLHHPVG